MKVLYTTFFVSVLFLGICVSCSSDDDQPDKPKEESKEDKNDKPKEEEKEEEVNMVVEFKKIGGFSNGSGDEGFAEISAFDPDTKKLFIVNPNDSELSVWNISNPASPTQGTAIALTGIPNSVVVHNKVVAVALENATNKQADGSIATYNTNTQTLLNTYATGPLPDMVTYSPDGKYLISANEGEPNDDYTVDPEGSITIVEVASGQINTASFSSFNGQDIGNHFRVFGPNATLSQDVEPEYIAVSEDSKKAYVTLQENNGLAVVNLETKTITSLLGLGVKDYSLADNSIDASDKDDIVGNFKNWPVYSFYQPDAITLAKIDGSEYLITANEGDSRDYDGFSEEKRLKKITLDPTVFPNEAELKKEENLGRLKITTANGDTDDDGDYDKIYAYGGRSFSIWSTSGSLIYDSGNQIAKKVFELDPSLFNANEEGKADKRSDDKGAEPEAVATIKVGKKTLLFVGLERTGGVMIYDISNPSQPVFLEWIKDKADISPEGLITVKDTESPTGNALIISTNEVSNTVAIYEITEKEAK